MCTDDKKCDEDQGDEFMVMVSIAGNPLRVLLDKSYVAKLETTRAMFENAPDTTKFLVRALQASEAGKGDEVQAILKEAGEMLNKAGII